MRTFMSGYPNFHLPNLGLNRAKKGVLAQWAQVGVAGEPLEVVITQAEGFIQ